MTDINAPHPDLGCAVCGDDDHCLPRWEDDGGRVDRPPSRACRSSSRRAPGETTDILLGRPSDGARDRPADRAARGRAGAGRVVHPASLTSREIEAEALVRLARGGRTGTGCRGDDGGHHEWQ